MEASNGRDSRVEQEPNKPLDGDEPDCSSAANDAATIEPKVDDSATSTAHATRADEAAGIVDGDADGPEGSENDETGSSSTVVDNAVDAETNHSVVEDVEQPGAESASTAVDADGQDSDEGTTDGAGDTADNADETADGEAAVAKKSNVWKQFFLSWRGVVAAVVIVAAIALPALWVKVVQPAMDKQKVAELTGYSNAAIVPYKHTWAKVDLDKDKVDNLSVNPDQWLLKNSEAGWAKSSCFTFHADGVDGKHVAKTTIAFGDSKSRDFFDSQASVFEDAMRNGKIDLQVCMLLTDDEYSALAMETLGEIDYNDPSNTWQAIKNLLKVDVAEMTGSSVRMDAALSAVKGIVNYDKKVSISEDSLKNGSFLQWSKVMTDAEKVEKIPAFWLDGENLSSQDKFKLSNPDVMHERLDALK